MKHHFYFKNLLIAMFVLFAGGGISAETETIVFSKQGYQNRTLVSRVIGTNIQIDFYKGTNSSNGPTYYDSGSAVRAYGGNYFIITANDITITKIVIGFGSSDGSNTITTNVGTYNSSGTWTGEAKSVTFTIGGTSGHRRIASIAVTYSTTTDLRTHVTLTYSAESFTTPTERGVVEGAPMLTVDPEEAEDEVTFSSSDETVATVDAQTGAITAVSRGTTSITASISDSENYRDALTSYELIVGLPSSNLNYDPTSMFVTYDKKDNFTAPTLSHADEYDGTITYASSNPSVATVDASGAIEILAVGVTTITASGAATQYHKASEASFTLTVEDIQGSATGASVFKETFDNANSSGGNEGGFSTASNQMIDKDIVCDNEGWTGGMYNAKKCVKIGKDGSRWTVTSPEITVKPGVPYTLTFKAAPWGTESNVMKVTVTGGSITEIPTTAMETGKWNVFEATITPASNSITIAFSVTGGYRFFLDEINVVASSGSETVSVTIPGSGYGTYCSPWPLDLTEGSLPDGFKAYAVSSSSSTNVTLTEISQKLIGGTGIIINGTPGTAYTLKIADNGIAYSGLNLLTGTLSPTYIEKGQYFLKNGQFVYSSAGTLPANKAYLKSANAPEAAANLDFVIEDVTGISVMRNAVIEKDGRWYDISGRAVSPTSKGIYIHNRKKYVIK